MSNKRWSSPPVLFSLFCLTPREISRVVEVTPTQSTNAQGYLSHLRPVHRRARQPWCQVPTLPPKYKSLWIDHKHTNVYYISRHTAVLPGSGGALRTSVLFSFHRNFRDCFCSAVGVRTIVRGHAPWTQFSAGELPEGRIPTSLPVSGEKDRVVSKLGPSPVAAEVESDHARRILRFLTTPRSKRYRFRAVYYGGIAGYCIDQRSVCGEYIIGVSTIPPTSVGVNKLRGFTSVIAGYRALRLVTSPCKKRYRVRAVLIQMTCGVLLDLRSTYSPAVCIEKRGVYRIAGCYFARYRLAGCRLASCHRN